MLPIEVFDKDRKIKTMGVEIFSPFVLNNGKIIQVDATYYYLMCIVGGQKNFFKIDLFNFLTIFFRGIY